MFASLLVVVSAAALGAFAQTSDPTACDRHYIVNPGDTCNGISVAQHVSTFQLAFVNPVINAGCTNLAVNQILCLGITDQDCSTIHQVASGDFCFSIAQGAGIDVPTLLANNPNVNSDCSNIGIGDVLCTAATVFNYTTTA